MLANCPSRQYETHITQICLLSCVRTFHTNLLFSWAMRPKACLLSACSPPCGTRRFAPQRNRRG